jgi:choline kinase
MHAGIILAAGRGSRMGSLTAEQPKCLTPLLDRTLLQWQLAALRSAGIEEIVVVAGYRADLLHPHAATIIVNDRWMATNMVGSLLLASHLLESRPCVVSYSDIVFHPAIVESLAASTGSIALTYDRSWRALWELRSPDPLADAETFRVRDGMVVEIGGRASTLDEIEGQFMGLVRYTPAGWMGVVDQLRSMVREEIDRLDTTALLDRLIRRGVRVTAVPVDGRWCEVDNERDLHLYRRALQRVAVEGMKWQHDWRWFAQEEANVG